MRRDTWIKPGRSASFPTRSPVQGRFQFTNTFGVNDLAATADTWKVANAARPGVAQ
jgi:hypothetical protein